MKRDIEKTKDDALKLLEYKIKLAQSMYDNCDISYEELIEMTEKYKRDIEYINEIYENNDIDDKDSW